MRKRTVLLLLLCTVIAFAPVTNWHVDENYIRGVVWRLTMMVTFMIGYFWNYIPARVRRRFRKLNKRLTKGIN